MAQFDVLKNTNRATKTLYPYLLDIQSDLLFDLDTTVVIPLTPSQNSLGSPVTRLHPVISILGVDYLAMTTLIAGIDRHSLGEKVASLEESRDEIISSLDLMITGI